MLLTVQEAAFRAGVSEKTIRRRIDEGVLSTFREGTRSKIRAGDLDRLFPHQLTGNRPVGIARVLAVANQKGGVGKTTTCANIAAALSESSRVLAIDCDPQGNLTQALGLNPDNLDVTLYNVLIDNLPLSRAIITPLFGRNKLSLVGSNLELSVADPQMTSMVARELRLKAVLEPLLGEYDYILLDCPPTLGILTINALAAATEVIVPVDMGIFSLRGVSKLLGTIEAVRAVNKDLTRVRALSNKSDNTNLTTEVQAELKSAFGPDLFATSVRKSVRIGDAQLVSTPITLFRPGDKASLDYHALAEEIRNG